MTHLDNILIFVKVAEFESLSRAARALNMPISTVSRKLSALESDLGVSLLRRTTRRVILTPQGRDYFNQCVEPMTKLQNAEQVLTQTQEKPEGTLAISVPMILSIGPFIEFLSRFSKEQPANSHRPVHHQCLPESGGREHRCGDPLRSALGFQRRGYQAR